MDSKQNQAQVKPGIDSVSQISALFNADQAGLSPLWCLAGMTEDLTADVADLCQYTLPRQGLLPGHGKLTKHKCLV